MTHTGEKKTGKTLAERYAQLDHPVEEKEWIRDAFQKGNTDKIQTLEDWVYLWIREILPNVIKDRTRLMYGETMERHILPYIGNLKLADLTAEQIEQWVKTLMSQEVPCTVDGKMKEGTVRNTISVLSGCLRDAQKRGLVQENPCMEVAETMTSRNVYEEKDWLTNEEIRNLQPGFYGYRAENGYPFGIAYELVLYAGISLSEVMALKWKDVSDSARMIHVHSVVLLRDSEMKNGGIYITEELQGRRRRKVPIPAGLMEQLQEIRTQYHRTDEDYVISETGKELLRLDRFRAYLIRCSKRMLNRKVTPRMLRDTYAIYMLRIGADSDTVAELLGFSSSRQIIKRYMPEKLMDRQQFVEQMYEQCIC